MTKKMDTLNNSNMRFKRIGSSCAFPLLLLLFFICNSLSIHSFPPSSVTLDTYKINGFIDTTTTGKHLYETININEGSSIELNPWSIVQQDLFFSYTCVCTTLVSYSQDALSVTEGNKTQTSYVYFGDILHGFYRNFFVRGLMPGTWSVCIYVNCCRTVANGYVFADYFVNYTINVDSYPEPKIVRSIKIPDNITLEVGSTYTFSPHIEEQGASTSMTWSSSNPSVVSVSDNGTIKAESAGMSLVKCTATNGVSSNYCTVNVSPIMIENIELDRKRLELEIGQKRQIRATIYPWDASMQNLEWNSSDNSIAKVNDNGEITALAIGECTITANSLDGSNVSASCIVDVLSDLFDISYIVNGEVFWTDHYSQGQTINPPDPPVQTGYSFVKWNGLPEVMPDHDVRVEAVYIKNKYGLTYVVDDEVYKTDSLFYGETIIPIEPPTKYGYTFDGWENVPDRMPANDITITGHFIAEQNNDADITNIDNVIYMDNIEASPGLKTAFPVNMKNTAPIRGFQFDLYLPSGVKAVKYANGRMQGHLNSSRLNDDDEHSLTISEQPDGGIRFLCGSPYDETFIGTEGEILYLNVQIDENIKEGDYSVILKNIKLTETDISQFYETSLLSSTLTIMAYKTGDINSDGKVDVSDYIGVANHIMGNTPDEFIENAADVDGNGAVDVSDYIGIANLIVTGTIYGK